MGTHMAYKLLRENVLKSHIFNVNPGQPSMENFHHFYSYLFIEFDKFWLECQPKDIMEFNRIRDLFENIVRTKLADPGTCFKVNIELFLNVKLSYKTDIQDNPTLNL